MVVGGEHAARAETDECDGQAVADDGGEGGGVGVDDGAWGEGVGGLRGEVVEVVTVGGEEGKAVEVGARG